MTRARAKAKGVSVATIPKGRGRTLMTEEEEGEEPLQGAATAVVTATEMEVMGMMMEVGPARGERRTPKKRKTAVMNLRAIPAKGE